MALVKIAANKLRSQVAARVQHLTELTSEGRAVAPATAYGETCLETWSR